MSSLMYHHSKFLGVKLGNLYLMLNGKPWNGRADHSFFLATIMMLRLIVCLILILERSYFDRMSSLMRTFLQFILHLQCPLYFPLLLPLFQPIFRIMRMMILVIPIYLHHKILHRCPNGLKLLLSYQDLQLVILPLPVALVVTQWVPVLSVTLFMMILRHLRQ